MTSDVVSVYEKYQGYLSQDPDNLELRFKTAEYAYYAGDLPQAKSLVEGLIASVGDQINLLDLLGRIYLAEQAFDEAEAIFARIVENQPDNPFAQYNLAYSLYQQRHYQKALELLETLSLRENPFIEAAVLKIYSLHNLSRVTEAIEFSTDYLNAHGESVEISAHLSTLYLDESDFAKAEEQAQHVLKVDGQNSEATSVLGFLALDRQQFEEAAGYYQTALAVDPTQGRAWLGMGMVQMAQKNIEEAAESFEQALQYMPTHIGTWHLLGWCAILQNDLEKAKHLFEKAYDLDRNFAESHATLSIIHGFQQQYVEALKYAKTAEKLDPLAHLTILAKDLLHQKADKVDDTLVQRLYEAYQKLINRTH